jgi:hypothetical protein
MPFRPVMLPDVTLGCAEDAVLCLLGQGGVTAVRAAGVDPAGRDRLAVGADGLLDSSYLATCPKGQSLVPRSPPPLICLCLPAAT